MANSYILRNMRNVDYINIHCILDFLNIGEKWFVDYRPCHPWDLILTAIVLKDNSAAYLKK